MTETTTNVVPLHSLTAAERIGAAYRRGIEAFIEVGEMLTAQKESMEHGEWLPWLEENKEALGFGERTARRLIWLAVNRTLASDLWGHTRGTFGTGDNEWHTPDIYLAMARKVLGEIDLDPASHEKAQERVKAKKFFTAEDDGLSREWHGRVWLNPPYAQPLIEKFVVKLCQEFTARRVTAAVMLTHNYTDTSWFQTAAAFASSVCFTRGRIRFIDLDGEFAAPTQGQAFCYFGKDAAKFARAFSDVGFVARLV